eukprot:6476674-Amphidinium_carterae.1
MDWWCHCHEALRRCSQWQWRNTIESIPARAPTAPRALNLAHKVDPRGLHVSDVHLPLPQAAI